MAPRRGRARQAAPLQRTVAVGHTPPMAAEAVTVVILVALLASVAQSVTAFGFALVSVPAMVFVLDVKDTVVVVSILALATEVLLAFRIWADVRWRTVGGLLVAG